MHHNNLIVKRLTKGMDLKEELQALCVQEHIEAAVLLSSVGSLSQVRVRDASGVHIQTIQGNHEILCLQGTLSRHRLHLHLTCADERLTCIGGHLVDGCIIHTTCELVILVLEKWRFTPVWDEQSGYDELHIALQEDDVDGY
ncbi:MAG: PPC domain-containing DNA-binding protein [Erysipelotrichaceae bacterium]